MILIHSKTTDYKFVIRGVFKLFQTEGVPLDIIFEFLILNNCIPDWLDLVQEMKSSGMKFSRILSKLDSAIVDTYGPEIRDIVISRLKINAKAT